MRPIELITVRFTACFFAGIAIVRKSIRQPCFTIAKNAGVDAASIVEKVLQNPDVNFGYDALKNEFTDMVERGIIDPTKVQNFDFSPWEEHEALS